MRKVLKYIVLLYIITIIPTYMDLDFGYNNLHFFFKKASLSFFC